MKILLSLLTMGMFFLSACTSGTAAGFAEISPGKAKERMEREDGHVLVDARSVESYSKHHIPGAICIPLEGNTDDLSARLPDKNQIILVYSETSNQSVQAAKKLASLGYMHVYEFGGINDWPFETVKGKEAPVLEFTAGSREKKYTAVMEDPSIASVTEETSEKGLQTNYVFTIQGVKPGETRLRIEERSESTGNYDHIYAVSIGDALNASVKALTSEHLDAAAEKRADLVVSLNGKNYYGGLETNATAKLFSEKLSQNPLKEIGTVPGDHKTLSIHLPWTLPIDKASVAAKAGDLVLTGSSEMKLVTEDTELLGVKLGSIADNDQSLSGMAEETPVTVSAWLEWSE